MLFNFVNSQTRLLPGIDVSWSSSNSNTSNGINAQTPMQHWRSVQLEACKLLELGCVLPATKLPHFQMYRWAFVGTEFDVHEEVPLFNGSVENLAAMPSALYVPHVRRVSRLMDMKFTSHSPVSNLTDNWMKTKSKKFSLFSVDATSTKSSLDAEFPAATVTAWIISVFSTLGFSCPHSCNYADAEQDVAKCLQEIEDVLAHDFLEKLPSITTPRWKLVAAYRQTTAQIQTTGLTQFELELNLGANGQTARIVAAVQAKLSTQNAETSFTQTTKRTNFPFYVWGNSCVKLYDSYNIS